MIPDRWAKYAQIQHKLQASTVLDHHAWGLEAAADMLLDELTEPEDADRAGRTAARRERHRRRLVVIESQSSDIVAPDIEGAVDARRQLVEARQAVGDPNWSLLLSVAEGEPYTRLAMQMGTSTGALRVRVLRLRHELRAAA